MSVSSHLIIHKVRGVPAIDVADLCEMGTPSDPGPWWIVSTSGHRAYPIASAPISDIPLCTDLLTVQYEAVVLDERWRDLPDHYRHVFEPTSKGKGSGLTARQLLERLNLIKPLEIRRRAIP